MARAIDAELLKENCKITGEFMNNFECVSLATLGAIIDKQPTIEAEPVKHGKWIKDKDRDMLRCSVCKNFCVENWYYWLRYCPDCGARMDGE